MAPKEGTVLNEGCNLHYWYEGSGPLLVIPPGGDGGGLKYSKTFPVLTKYYTVATFDRRQMSASTVSHPKPLNVAQQARDLIAVVKALGFSKTSVIGHSGGGIITLQLIIDYPDMLEKVLLHEVPVDTLLPESTKMLDMVYEIIDVYKRQGVEAAMAYFGKSWVGMESPMPVKTPEQHAQVLKNHENFFENEIMFLPLYCPDLRKIKANLKRCGILFACSVGKRSKGASYARTMDELAGIIGCKNYEVPGSHFMFEYDPNSIAQAFLEILQNLTTVHT